MFWTLHSSGCPRRVNHAAVDVGHRIFSFGGYCTGDNYREKTAIDVFILNTESCRWTELQKPTENCEDYANWPFQRYGHTVSSFGDQIVLFGGRNDISMCNTVFIFDILSLKWFKPSVSGRIPLERDGHSSCVINGALYIYGGYEMHHYAREIYRLDLRSFVWTEVEVNGRSPLLRDFHSATAIGDKMYIFGGRAEIENEEFYSLQTSYLDTTTNTWFHPPIPNGPLGRRSHSAVHVNNKLLIFGGYNGKLDIHYNDLWCLDPIQCSWSKLSPIGKRPNPRRRHVMIRVEQRLFLFGGTSPYDGPPIVFTEEQIRFLPHPQQFDNTNSKLIDHDDMFVLDLSPSLKTLCLLFVIKNKIPFSTLPSNLKNDIKSMTSPNLLSKPLRTLPLG